MPTIVARLSSNGVYFTSTHFDEVTYDTSITNPIKISLSGIYSGGFDEITIQGIGGGLAKKETNNGEILISGYFDEYTLNQIPNIVLDGLSLYLDAGNPSSYSGNGNTWYDISGYNNNSILTNITYNSSNGGYLYFDNSTTDPYANFTASNINGNWVTVEMWVNLASNYSNGMFMSWGSYDIWTSGGNIGYNTYQSDIYGISQSDVASLGLVGNWVQYVFVMNNQDYTNNIIYINGISQTLSQQINNQNPYNLSFNSGNGNIGNGTDINFPIQMNLSIYRVYNRQLSQIEVNQNFNANRGRFGI